MNLRTEPLWQRFWITLRVFMILQCITKLHRGYPLSTYAKFSEKLIFLTLLYGPVRGRIRGFEILVFRKILRTYLMDDSIGFEYVTVR